MFISSETDGDLKEACPISSNFNLHQKLKKYIIYSNLLVYICLPYSFVPRGGMKIWITKYTCWVRVVFSLEMIVV